MRSVLTQRLMFFRAAISGASAIEFAIIAPIFFILIFGIIIYGYYFATLSLVSDIAYEAARATISGLSDDERSALAHAKADALIGALSGLLGENSVEVDAGPSGTGLYAVTVHHHFDAFQLVGTASLLPLPPEEQTITVEISHGGY